MGIRGIRRISAPVSSGLSPYPASEARFRRPDANGAASALEAAHGNLERARDEAQRELDKVKSSKRGSKRKGSTRARH